jgi:hypothetical protein
VFWLIPTQGNEGHVERIVLALVCMAAIVAATSLGSPKRLRT